MDVSFKDYVIEQFRPDEEEPLPDEPDEDQLQGESYKDTILARRFDPDTLEIINDLSKLLVQKRGNIVHFRVKARDLFHVIFKKLTEEDLVRPIFDYLEMYGDNQLIISAFNAICTHHLAWKKCVPDDCLKILRKEIEKRQKWEAKSQERRLEKQNRGPQYVEPPRRKKVRKAISRMSMIPEDSEVEFRDSPQEAQEPRKKRARLAEADLICTESMA